MAQPKETPDVAEAKPGFPLAVVPAKPLANNRLKLICSSASDIGNHWAAIVPAGVSFAAVLHPEFWSNHSTQLRAGDVIDVHADGREFFGRVYVRDTARTRTSVAKLEFHEFGALMQSAEPLSHRVEYAGLHSKWAIRRMADGKLIKEGLESQEAAELALKGMERSMNKVA